MDIVFQSIDKLLARPHWVYIRYQRFLTNKELCLFNTTVHSRGVRVDCVCGDDSSDNKSVIEIEPPKENGEQEIGKQNKLLTTKFQIQIENRKVKGLITYSTEQHIFKFYVNSGNNQELWGVNTDFSSYELK